MNKVIYPGSFDPITNGHIGVIERAANIFDEVVVAIAVSEIKKPLFDINERELFAKEVLSHFQNVSVIRFDNLLIDFAKSQGANIIIRGLRAVSDFDFEFQLASMNRQLDPSIETLFLTPSEDYAFLSSSLVREIASLRGNVKPFVPTIVSRALEAIYKEKLA